MTSVLSAGCQVLGAQRTLLIVSVAMLTQASPTYADEATGWYVGAGAGQSQGRDYCDPQPGVVIHNCDDAGVAWKLFVGYEINRYLGVEGGYLNLGGFSANVTAPKSPASIDTRTWTGYVEGVATLPLGSRFALFAKAGGVYWNLEGKASLGGAAPGNETNNGFDFIAGGGAQVMITRNLGIRAEYELIPKLGNGDSGEVDVRVISASVIWKF